VSTRRLLPLGLGVTALLVLAGIASHGRPLSGGRGRGPTATFFDYVATTLVIFAVLMLAVMIWALFSERTGSADRPKPRSHLVSTLVMFVVAIALSALISRHSFLDRLQQLEQRANTSNQTGQTLPKPQPEPAATRNPRLRWDEIGIVIALLAGTAVVLVASRQTRRPVRPWRFGREQEVSLALDESIDDLRSDPDLRRAIIAAYARMEHALARVGLARHPAEAPFEYVERALRTLDTSAEAVRRLTGLFEWAKFSQHEPEPEMRDEAIDALIAVRDELRAPDREAVPA
jgi:cell division protein FtsB